MGAWFSICCGEKPPEGKPHSPQHQKRSDQPAPAPAPPPPSPPVNPPAGQAAKGPARFLTVCLRVGSGQLRLMASGTASGQPAALPAPAFYDTPAAGGNDHNAHAVDLCHVRVPPAAGMQGVLLEGVDVGLFSFSNIPMGKRVLLRPPEGGKRDHGSVCREVLAAVLQQCPDELGAAVRAVAQQQGVGVEGLAATEVAQRLLPYLRFHIHTQGTIDQRCRNALPPQQSIAEWAVDGRMKITGAAPAQL